MPTTDDAERGARGPGPHEDPDNQTPSIDRTVAKLFVSPRVIDQRAFDELSGTLRSLVKDAVSQSRMLLSTSGDVRSLSDTLRSATRELDDRVRSAAAVVPELDQKIQSTDRLLASAREELSAKIAEFRQLIAGPGTIDAEAIRARVGAVVEETLGPLLAARLDQWRESLATHAQRAAAPLDSLRETALEAAARAERAQARARDLLERVETALLRLEDSRSHIAAAQEDLTDAASAALERSEALRLAAAEASHRVERAQQELDDAASRITVRLEEGLARLEPQLASIESQGTGILARLREQMAQAAEQTGMLDLASAHKTASDLADAVGQATEAALTLRELAAGITAQRTQAEAATRTFATMASQAQQAGMEVGNRILAAAEWIDGLDRTMAQLEERSKAVTQEASARLDSLAEAGQAATAAQEIGPRLAMLVRRADDIGRGLDQLLRRASDPGGEPGAPNPS